MNISRHVDIHCTYHDFLLLINDLWTSLPVRFAMFILAFEQRNTQKRKKWKPRAKPTQEKEKFSNSSLRRRKNGQFRLRTKWWQGGAVIGYRRMTVITKTGLKRKRQELYQLLNHWPAKLYPRHKGLIELSSLAFFSPYVGKVTTRGMKRNSIELLRREGAFLA